MAKAKKKVTRKKVATPFDTFFVNFIGEYVEIIAQFSLGDARSLGRVMGYLLDVDDNYYYLGVTAGEVSTAVRRDTVQVIDVVTPPSYYKDLLDNMDVSKEAN